MADARCLCWKVLPDVSDADKSLREAQRLLETDIQTLNNLLSSLGKNLPLAQAVNAFTALPATLRQQMLLGDPDVLEP